MRRSAIVSERAVKRRRRKRTLWTTLALFVAGLLVVGLVWLSQANFLIIQRIDVEGAGETLERNVLLLVESKLEEHLLWLFPKSNMLLFPKDLVEEEIVNTYTRIKCVEIKRKGFSRLEITIEERDPNALWCDAGIVNIGNCYFVDGSGYIFRRAPYFSDHVYYELYGGPLPALSATKRDLVLEAVSSSTASSTQKKMEDISISPESFLGTYYLQEEMFILTMLFVRALEQEGIPTYALVVYDEHHFELSLGEGGVLKFSPTQDLAKAARDFKIAYEKRFEEDSNVTPADIEYVDIRFTNKVVFKFTQ